MCMLPPGCAVFRDAGAQFENHGDGQALLGKIIMPGALTPTENRDPRGKPGADFVKVFPCGAAGWREIYQVAESSYAAYRDGAPKPAALSLETTADFLRAGAAAVAWARKLI